MSAKKEPQYKYSRLGNLRVDEHVNVYGVLKYAKQPSHTRTNQYCMSLGLMDDTLNVANGEALHCILFGKTTEELPIRATSGDIVRFHRLRIVNYNGKLQGKMGVGFSWLLIKKDHKEPSSERYTFTQNDETMLSNMQRWASTSRDVSNAIRCSDRLLSLGDLTTEELWFNTVVQVYSVNPSVNDETCHVLRVWDGTIPPCPSYNPCMYGEPYEEPSEELQRYATKRILDFHVYDDHQEQARSLNPGEFIRVTNIHSKFVVLSKQHTVNGSMFEPEFEEHPNFLSLFLHQGTAHNRGIVKLQGTEPEVNVIKKRIKALIQEKDAANVGASASTSGSMSSSVPQNATGSASNISSNNASRSTTGAASTDVPQRVSTGASASTSNTASNDASRSRMGAASTDVSQRASTGASASASNVASNDASRSRMGAASTDVSQRASTGASASASNVASNGASKRSTGAASTDVHQRASTRASASTSNIASNGASRSSTGAASTDVSQRSSTGASASTTNIALDGASRSSTGAASTDVPQRASTGASTGASASTSNIASDGASRSSTGAASTDVPQRASTRASTGASASTSNIASDGASRSSTGAASTDVPQRASTRASTVASTRASSNASSKRKTDTEIKRQTEPVKKAREEVKGGIEDSAIWKSSTSGNKRTSNDDHASTSKDSEGPDSQNDLAELNEMAQGPAFSIRRDHTESSNMDIDNETNSADVVTRGDILDIMARKITPAKFSCELRLTDIQPRTIGEGVNISCEACKYGMCLERLPQQILFTDVTMKCVNCKADLKEDYSFVLTLEDGCGTVEANLSGKDAEMFFSNTTANECRRNKDIHDKLGQMIGTLVSSLDNATDKPLVDCVIEAFRKNPTSDVDSYRVSNIQMPNCSDEL